MASASLEEFQASIRRRLAQNGTNLKMNDADPQGDGDQSRLGHLSQESQQEYREIFATGGDLQYLGMMELRPLSTFVQNCVMGQVKAVEAVLERIKPGPRLIEKLETREGALRLSPLLFIVSMGKNIAGEGPSLDDGQEQVAKLLLSYGANAGARDVCGKTVCHYGMGAMATDMTLAVGSACIEAYEFQHFCHQRVELHGLSSQPSMNGKQGYCRGFVADAGRCAILLPGQTEPVGIKPINLKLVNGNNAAAPTSNNKKLCDIPDRLGGVCLLEVIQAGRTDVAQLLLKKYDPDLEISDCDGISPKSMALNTGLVSRVSTMIVKHLAKTGRQEMKVQREQNRSRCCHCQKEKSTGSAEVMKECARCRQVWYCSRDCQKKDWKAGHKAACGSREEEGIVLDKPQGTGFSATINFATGRPSAPRKDSDGYQKPRSARVNEKFYVKVQGGGPVMPLMVYDKSREFNICVNPGQAGFEQMRAKVNAEPAFQGRKTYMSASFDGQGRCIIYPHLTSMKTW